MNTKRILAAILASLMLLPALTACTPDTPDSPDTSDTSVQDTTASGGDTSDTAAPADTTTAETEPRETERHEIKDDLPKDLNFGGRTFTAYVGRIAANDQFVLGSEEFEGDVVNDAVYERNINVQEQLKFTLKADGYEMKWNTIGPAVSTLILAGDSTYDIFMGQQYGMTALVGQRMFVNAYELKHINFEQPWWMNDYMDALSLGNKYRFLLISDFNTQAISNIRANIFNKTLYEKIYGNPDELYRLTLDGKFTLDYMSQLMKGAYADLNGDGVTDIDDQLGLITDGLYASVDSFVYAADIPFTSRDKEGFVQLTMINDRAITLAEKLCAFFQQQAVLTRSSGRQKEIFAKGTSLFLGNGMLVQASELRDMEDDFGILPHPKLDETQKEYRSLVHDQALLTGVSIASVNLDMVGAVLEALSAESYRRVTPAYYETALKMKYSRDSISSQMIDLIKNTMTTEFIFAYNSSMNNLGQIYRTMITNNLPNYVSNVEARIGAAETNLADLIKVFKGE
ncbi:MAG: hypothetical protein E7463_14220 [Ruminococcaceae bacterium]|nr:hypothetical protein [Oscillospiraceae bacterium]